jgi:hypothetical protein
MKTHILEGKNIAEDFNDWMVSIGNIHLANNNLMAKAFEKLGDNEEI